MMNDAKLSGKHASDEALFPSDSPLRKMRQEAVTLLGGGRTLLLQLAHPLVAAGVAQHSRFRENPLGRLASTIDLMTNLVRGNRPRAELALERFQRAHASVQGRLSQDIGLFPAGTRYSAQDLELKLWIHVTYVDTTLITYERFVSPLTCQERTRFYEDGKQLAQLLGIPAQMLPPTLADFNDYMQGMLQSDILTVSDTARTLACETVIAPKVWFVARMAGQLARFVTAGILPPRFRREYGLVWDARRQLILEALSHFSRRVVPRPSACSSPAVV